MSKRSKQLRMVRGVYEKELDARARELARAREAAEAAEKIAVDAAARARVEADSYISLREDGLTADQWREHQAWVEELTRRARATREQATLAQESVAEARNRVTEARQRVERLDVVLEKLAAQARAAEARAARVAEDEHGARAARGRAGGQ